MIYNTESIQIRIMWTNFCIAELGWRLIQDRKGGRDCTCLVNKIMLLSAYIVLLCSYDEDAEFNILSVSQVDNIVENISKTCDICFDPNH